MDGSVSSLESSYCCTFEPYMQNIVAVAVAVAVAVVVPPWSLLPYCSVRSVPTVPESRRRRRRTTQLLVSVAVVDRQQGNLSFRLIRPFGH